MNRYKNIGYAFLGMLLTSPALASTDNGSYGWDKFFNWLFGVLSSNVTLAIGLIVVVIAGLTLCFGDLQGAGKKALWAGVGVGIAISASNIMTNAFNLGALIH